MKIIKFTDYREYIKTLESKKLQNKLTNGKQTPTKFSLDLGKQKRYELCLRETTPKELFYFLGDVERFIKFD